MRKRCLKFTLGLLSLAAMSASYAATPVRMEQLVQQSVVNPKAAALSSELPSFQRINSHTDQNKVSHIRVQQYYQGLPVWGGEGIIHTNNPTTQKLVTSFNRNDKLTGIYFAGLEKDLKAMPILNDDQAKKALDAAVTYLQKQTGIQQEPNNISWKKMIFINKNHQARLAYFVLFHGKTNKKIPAHMVSIVDALTFEVYQQWNTVKTFEEVKAGGNGGNKKVGEVTYDGLTNHLPQLNILRDTSTAMCFLENHDIIVKTLANNGSPDGDDGDLVQFACKGTNASHNNEYWDGEFDAVNGAYSPSNDAFYNGVIIKNMYQQWYGIPVLVKDGKPEQLIMRVHAKDPDSGSAQYDNAYWNGQSMTFGDGADIFYPLVSLDVAAHEISHGFTEQHSGLTGFQSAAAGLNEAFSDMAAKAAQYYMTGTNTWLLGEDIIKQDGFALRYLSDPKKDCELWNGTPGESCSIDNAKDFQEGIDEHFSAGVFNKAFYLIASAPNWNTKKAFDVMIKANMDYWTSTTSFEEAACGVMSAAKDLKYDTVAIVKAMKEVGIDVNKCTA